MPSALTYPGVYIEEIPSGVRTITGVATSVTAFLGRAGRGPTDDDVASPLVVNSYGDFERHFGGLDPDYPMGYAVRDFFLNGGGQAAIVRLFKEQAEGESAATPARARIDVGTGGAVLRLEAASPGSWGNTLRVRIDHDVSAEVAGGMGLAATDLFNLTVRDTASGDQEAFVNLSAKESPRRVDRVLAAGSALLRSAREQPLPDDRPEAHGVAAAGQSVWDDPAASGGAPLSTRVADDAKAGNGVALDDTAYLGAEDKRTGLHALRRLDLFNLLCIPPGTRGGSTSKPVYQAALAICVEKRAMLIVDPPDAWTGVGAITKDGNAALTALGLNGRAARNAALFFPRVKQSDPRREGQVDTFVPCGVVAGVMARTDVQRGVWKAPAGIDAALNGVQGLAVGLDDREIGQLNPLGVNCLRSLPLIGPVAWGARTMRGADLLADEYKYVPVRRLALYIEESLYRGTQWVVFEPNDEPLWSQIRLNVGAFMHNLFRQGAFQGRTPQEAYFVKCDGESTTQGDINLGIVNIVVGFAPLKPAEFVVIKLQQMAGQIQA